MVIYDCLKTHLLISLKDSCHLCLCQDVMEAFYNTPPMGQRGTSSYLTKAVMIQLLQGDVKPCKDDPCSVS